MEIVSHSRFCSIIDNVITKFPCPPSFHTVTQSPTLEFAMTGQA